MHHFPASAYYHRWSYAGLLLLAVLIGVTHVASAQKQTRRKAKTNRAVTINQGICGTVTEKRGNHMPSPDDPRPTGNGQPVPRDVLIFPLLNASQIDMGENGFINSVRQIKPIKTVKSDSSGKFCVDLPAGRYSVVVREPKGLYANLSDTQNNIFPVTVNGRQKTQVDVIISHSAVF
jgi:hypothetical protein